MNETPRDPLTLLNAVDANIIVLENALTYLAILENGDALAHKLLPGKAVQAAALVLDTIRLRADANALLRETLHKDPTLVEDLGELNRLKDLFDDWKRRFPTI